MGADRLRMATPGTIRPGEYLDTRLRQDRQSQVPKSFAPSVLIDTCKQQQTPGCDGRGPTLNFPLTERDPPMVAHHRRSGPVIPLDSEYECDGKVVDLVGAVAEQCHATEAADDGVTFRMRNTEANRQHNSKLLAQWDTQRTTAWRTFTATAAGGITDKRLKGYTEATLAGCVKDVGAQRKGSRNHVLNVKAYKLGAFVNEGLLTRNVVEAGLFAASEGNKHVADDGARMARNTIKSGLDSAARKHLVPNPPPEIARGTTQVLDAGEFDEDETPTPTTELEAIAQGYRTRPE